VHEQLDADQDGKGIERVAGAWNSWRSDLAQIDEIEMEGIRD